MYIYLYTMHLNIKHSSRGPDGAVELGPRLEAPGRGD